MASRDYFLPPNDTGFDAAAPPPSEAASAPRRRVDMRWSRVAMAQLEDDEFLQKQLRRLEIAASARQAGRRRATERSNEGGAVQEQSIRDRVANARAKAARGAHHDAENDDKSEVADAQRAAADRESDEQREREIADALCIIAELDNSTRGALIQQRLTAALRQQSLLPNPVYKLVALRRQIMRHIQVAVTAQHQHRVSAAAQWTATVDAIRQALQPPSSPSVDQASNQAIALARGCTDSDASTAAKSQDVARAEGHDAIQTLTWMLARIRDATASTDAQKKEFLRDILQLLSALPRLALSPLRPENASAATFAGGKSATRNWSPDSVGRALEMASLVDSIHEFLLDVAPKPTLQRRAPVSPKVQAVTPANREIDIDDRTNAVNALAQLAGATGSLRDFLVLVKVLLGVPNMSHEPAPSPCPCTSNAHSSLGTSRVVNASTLEQVKRPTSRESIEAGSEPRTNLRSHGFGHGDLSSRKARQERLVHSDELETTSENEKASPIPPCKPGTKTFASKSSNPTMVNPVSPATRAPSLEGALSQRNHSGSTAKVIQRDEYGDVALPTGSLSLSVSTDFNAIRHESSARTARTPTSRTDAHLATSRCPKLKSLRVYSVIEQLDEAEPAVPTQASKARSGSGSPGGATWSIRDADAGDEGDEREVWSCGQNSYGELGHGDTTSRKSFERIESLQNKEIVFVGAGNEHTVALSEDGSVYSCGYNDNGQCGQGGTARVTYMTEIPKIDECSVTQVHAFNGCEHTIMVLSNGRAATCGYNYRGQLGHGNSTSESVPKLIRSLEGRIVRLVSCSYYHTVMTCEDVSGGAEYLMTFGRNDYGQLGHNDSIDRKVPQHVGVFSDHHVVSVACGQYHTMVVTSNGRVFGFGKNDYGQLGVDSVENQLLPVQVRGTLDKHIALEVRSGYYHTIVLCAGAHLFGFGRNDYGQLGLGKFTSHPTANSQLQRQRFSQPYLIEDLEGKEIVRFACGCYHTAAVSESGMLYVFGRNNHGQLGTGDTNERLYPFPIDEFLGKRVALVAAGFYHTVVLTGGKDTEKEGQDGTKDGKNASVDEDGDRLSFSGQPGVSFADVLVSPVILKFLQTQRSLASQPKRGDGFRLQFDFDGLSPALDGLEKEEGDTTRVEDHQDKDDSGSHDRGTATSPESNAKGCNDSSKGLPLASQDSTSPSSPSESMALVAFIFAQLDRLSQNILPRTGTQPALSPVSAKAISSLLNVRRGSVADLGALFPGGTEAHVIHVRSATLEHLCALILHLSQRKVDAIAQLQCVMFSPADRDQESEAPPLVSTGSHNLQLYMLLVSLRLLRANLAQLMRSGIAQAVLAYIEASRESSEPQSVPTKLVGCAKELDALKRVLQHVRDALVNVIDAKHRRNTLLHNEGNSDMTAHVTLEAVTMLMESFDVLMPCQCLQIRFYEHVLRDAAPESPSANCWCSDICRHGLAAGGVVTLKSRALVVTPLLKRMMDDATVLKQMPFSITAALSCSLSSSAPRSRCKAGVGPLRFITSTYRILLDLLARHFRHQLYQEPQDDVFRDQKTLLITTSALQMVQKHIACWALECPRWNFDVQDADHDAKPPRSIQNLVARVIDSTFRVDQSVCDTVPASWRAMIEFALAVTSACCQSLVLISAHPPSHYERQRTRSSSTSVSTSASGNSQPVAVGLLEQSVVGQLLPSLLTAMFEFTNKPLFAVALLPNVKGLLKLLDSFNRQFLSLEEMDKAFIESVASQLSGSSNSSTSRGSSVGATMDREAVGGLSRIGTSRLRQAATNAAGQTSNVSEALALPWNYRLEKELAILSSEMVVTLATGEPLAQCSTASDEHLESFWLLNPLLRGGLNPSLIARSVQISEGSCVPRRIVTHSPFPTAAQGLPPSMSGEFLPFSLVLPAVSASEFESSASISVGAQPIPGKTLLDIRKYRRVFSHASTRRFLMTLVTDDSTSGDEWVAAGHRLCEWIRDWYIKTDASYRMLQQMASKARKPLPHEDQRDETIRLNDMRIDAAVFAVLLHHNSLAFQAFHFALVREADGTQSPPPPTFIKLWRFVADLRRQVASKKTALRSQQRSDSTTGELGSSTVNDPKDQILDLQRALLERCELLLLVDVWDEETHANTERDAGFFSPASPAVFTAACAHYTVKDPASRTGTPSSLKAHLQTRYTEDNMPFLAAFPFSKWRLIRVLVHTVSRWRSCCDGSCGKKSGSSSETTLKKVSCCVVQFVASSEVAVSASTIRQYLVDPCRRRSCSARGFEILWELLATISYDSIQADLVHQVTQALVFQARGGPPLLAGSYLSLENAGVFYTDLYNNALADFLMQLTELIADKASAAVDAQDFDGVGGFWVLGELLASWGMRFNGDQFEFVHDIGVLPLIHQLLRALPGAELLEADKARQGALYSSRANSLQSGLETARSMDAAAVKQSRMLHRTLWTVFQSVCANFASPSSASALSTRQQLTNQLEGLSAVVYPVLSEPLEILYAEALHVSQMAVPSWQQTTDAPDASNATTSAPGGIRRSFDLLTKATRFSRLHHRLTFEYQDMLTPLPGKAPMSSLLKPNEFSITTWMFIRGSPSANLGSDDDFQLVFARGDGSELGPYLMVVPETASTWQLEVGFVLHIDDSEVGSGQPKARHNNVLCERMMSKEPVPSDRWIHVAIVVETTKVRLYLNGMLDSQRAITSQYMAAWWERDVGLPFHFGRFPVHNSSRFRAPMHCSSASSPPNKASTANAALGLLSSSLSSKSSRFHDVSETPRYNFGCFDGWLSQFRFHNRALSPIHVRIVYDELKPSTSGVPITSRSARSTTPLRSPSPTTSHEVRVLDLHALLIQLSSSPEGVVYFRDQFTLWMHLIWRTFICSGSFQLQQSSLRVLQSLLPRQDPAVVTSALLLADPTDSRCCAGSAFGLQGLSGGFVRQILRTVGFGLVYIQSDQPADEGSSIALPWSLMIASGVHGSTFAPITTSDAVSDGKLPSDIAQLEGAAKRRNMFLVNELTELLQRLYLGLPGAASALWKEAIKDVVISILTSVGVSVIDGESEGASRDAEPTQTFKFRESVVHSSTVREAELLGCLYFLSGPNEISLRPGAAAQLRLTYDPVRVISIEAPPPAATGSDGRISGDTSVVNRSAADIEMCVVVGEDRLPNLNQPLGTLRGAEYANVRCDELLPSLSAGLLASEPLVDDSTSGIHIGIKQALLARARAVCSNVCEQLVLTRLWPCKDLGPLTTTCGTQNPYQFSVEESLQLMQTGNMLLKCLVQGAQDTDFALEILQDEILASMVFTSATENDGGSVFETLESVERKAFLLRQRVYSVLIDLREEGHQELRDYLESTIVVEDMEAEASLEEKSQPTESIAEQETVIHEEEDEVDGLTIIVDNATTGESSGSKEEDEMEEGKGNDEGLAEDSEEELNEPGDEDEELDEDSDMEEHRAEFVDELALMGFPDEWCLLALKQTENDVVGASAWIVDNLDYLSKLQTLLDKKREDDRISLRFNEDDDDEEQDESIDFSARGEEPSGSPLYRPTLSAKESANTLVSVYASSLTDKGSPAKHTYDSVDTGAPIPAFDEGQGVNGGVNELPSERSSAGQDFQPPPLNDKETGRKIFGEMYFPLEEGGYLSNTGSSFQSAWPSGDAEMKAPSSPTSDGSTTQAKQRQTNSSSAFSDSTFEADTAQLDVIEMAVMLRRLERQLMVLYCRFLAVSVLKHMNAANNKRDGTGTSLAQPIPFSRILTLARFVVRRGDQFGDQHCALRSANASISTEQVMRRVVTSMLAQDSDKNVPYAIDYLLEQVETAAWSKHFEASLWTQRELQRPDEQVLAEPAVEVAVWLADCIFDGENNSTNAFLTRESSSSLVQMTLRRLRFALGATNLPLKCFVLRTISRLLLMLCRSLGDHDGAKHLDYNSEILRSLVVNAKISAQEVKEAAKQRLAREAVQERHIYSLYVQAYVELLHTLHVVSTPRGVDSSIRGLDAPTDSLPPTSFDLGATTSPREEHIEVRVQDPPLTAFAFDRKRNRTGLLSYSEDGRTVAYSGNDAWKATCAEQRLATGQHAWAIRIDKSSLPYIFVGVATRRLNVDSFLGADDQSWGFIGDKALYYQRSRVRAFGEPFGEGDVIGVHLDCERGTLAFTKNGSPLGVAFDNIVGEVYPAIALYSRHQRVSLLGGVAFESMDTTLTSGDDLERSNQPLTPSPPALPLWATGTDSGKGSIDDCLVACEVMASLLERRPVRPALMQVAYQLTTQWLAGSKHYVTTRAGWSLWVDVTPDECGRFGFRAGERVRTSRGSGTVAGVAYGRVWVHVAGEAGAWFFHPSKLRAHSIVATSTDKVPAEVPEATAVEGSEGPSRPMGSEPTELAIDPVVTASATDPEPVSAGSSDEPPRPVESQPTEPARGPVGGLALSFEAFTSLAQDLRWGGVARDRELMRVVNDHCESTRTSPWNVSPDALLQLIRDKQQQQPGVLDTGAASGSFVLEDDPSARNVSSLSLVLVARFALLRYLNLALSRSLPFLDLTWRYYARGDGDMSGGVSEPCRLLSACRGSVFLCLKSAFFASLLQRTANSPRKAEDEYDYPDDLPQLQVNRLKAAAAKCHPGSTKSLFLSLFGQAFEVLHFLPLRTRRMVYSHPMDDGQLRSFKVKFEGEGADDYGGPYREFFSQFFAELQALAESPEGEGEAASNNRSEAVSQHTEAPTACLLPFLVPSPNWRSGVGSSRERFVLNASLVAPLASGGAGASTVDTARRSLLGESPEEKRQLYREMFVFLGQMLGTCLRTGVCVRLDLATSVWQQIVAEDDATLSIACDLADGSTEGALAALKEVDFVAYSLWRSLKALLDEHERCRAASRPTEQLAEQLAAMDLEFTTTLSDGRTVELRPGGASVSVALDNLAEYLRLVLDARVHEAREAVALVKRGLHSILPVSALGLLTWRELETRVCGVDEIDVALLRANTEYDEDVAPTDEFVLRLWRVLEAMDTPDRRAFLRFVWARSRLPLGASQFHQKFKIQLLAVGGGANDGGGDEDGGSSSVNEGSGAVSEAAMDAQLPRSHTCFFALQLPRYSSDEVCRKQLLYAVHNCVEMDGDFRLADTEMTGWTDVSASDQLRL